MTFFIHSDLALQLPLRAQGCKQQLGLDIFTMIEAKEMFLTDKCVFTHLEHPY